MRLLREPLLLGGLTALAAGIWIFVKLSEIALDGSPHAFDEWALLILRTPGDPADPIGPRWVEEMMRDLTALGGVAVTSLITLATTVLLAMQGRAKMSLYILTTVLGGVALSLALKSSFDRPRPNLVPYGSHVYTQSFPSGHSMTASATYLTLGALLAERVRRRRARVFILLLTVLVLLAVGFSRVYLGVHWATDVLAGWVAGGLWALLCWAVAAQLQIVRVKS